MCNSWQKNDRFLNILCISLLKKIMFFIVVSIWLKLFGVEEVDIDDPSIDLVTVPKMIHCWCSIKGSLNTCICQNEIVTKEDNFTTEHYFKQEIILVTWWHSKIYYIYSGLPLLLPLRPHSSLHVAISKTSVVRS
mgnify:CR=1 FL=1